ncbi:hypothetical protein ACLE20_06950 [Rhizobium sp. YIM 134829]|uniref:hypothetical protein n=1 Tax=Rhizobium sp. YIM 134829 TaxID=3390453 RepID=UPI00397CB0A4
MQNVVSIRLVASVGFFDTDNRGSIMSDTMEKKARELRVPVLLRGAEVMESFRENLLDAANRAGVSPNEFVFVATAEKLMRSGRHFSGVFRKGDLSDLNDGMGAA